MNHPLRPATAALVGVLAHGLLLSAPAALMGQSAPRAPAAFSLPAPDSVLQQRLGALMREQPYRRLVDQRRLSVALVDVTDPDRVVFAGWDSERMRYAASLPKIAILAGVFDQIERGQLGYTPALRTKLERMIRNSDNAISSEMIRLVGFQNIARTLQDPRHMLYDRRRGGGLWVGRGYGGLGLWRRDPIGSTSHGANARQVARFFVMMERGELVSPWASAEMKSILAHPAIHHKFVLGLEQARPRSVIYRKSGTWQNYHADAALVERDGRKYVAVVLLESPTNSSQGVLASLIVRLDDMIFRSQRVARRGATESDWPGRTELDEWGDSTNFGVRRGDPDEWQWDWADTDGGAGNGTGGAGIGIGGDGFGVVPVPERR